MAVEEYDPATNTWARKASMPTARFELGLAAATNGKLYAIGGLHYVPFGVQSGFVPESLATVEEFTP